MCKINYQRLLYSKIKKYLTDNMTDFFLKSTNKLLKCTVHFILTKSVCINFLWPKINDISVNIN